MSKNICADVRFNNEKWEKWIINNGSRQGGILSPLLFNFNIKRCIEDIVNHDVRCIIGLDKWNVLAYADNFVLMAPSLKRLPISPLGSRWKAPQTLASQWEAPGLNPKLT